MLSADGSVGSPHVRVGHRQDLISKKAVPERERLFFAPYNLLGIFFARFAGSYTLLIEFEG